jgi:multidrug efflux pump subunit AcrB
LAVTVIPFLEVLIIKPEKTSKSTTDNKRITDRVQSLYNRVLDVTFRHPWATIASGMALVLLSLLIVPQLKLRQFPYADRDQFAVEIFLSEGKGLADARALADSLRIALSNDENVTGVTSFIGCASPRFMVCYAPQMAGKNFAQLIVNTTSQQATLNLMAQYQPQWSEHFPDAYIRFKRLDYLEVSELEYRFYGDNLDSLHVASELLMDRMRQMPELEWVHTDFMQPYPIVSVELDPVSSAQLGISRATAALALTAATGNLTVGQLWEGNYSMPIVIRDTCTLSFSDIADVPVTSPVTMLSGINNGNTTVPLRQIANVKPKWTESRIMHRAGERCMTVTAQFAQGVYAAPIEARIADVMHDIPLPEGIRTEVGGEIEYNGEMLPQIISGIAISMFIIFFFLLLNFKKFGITTICMIALVLMAPGALIGLGLMNRTLGITSIMGLITLMGMIMRNEILIFEHANNLLKATESGTPPTGTAVRQAAYEAGRRRMVPIFLTTATTAVGVVPMIIAGSSFWMPVGVTIFAGGIGSLILVVTMLPVVYWKVSLKGKRVKR